MKRKIIAGLCGGAMAAVSCLGFAGCGGGQEHKHVYKDYYELAGCTDPGYTLHCCTECDYMFADDFVMPYEHAYEHCVNLALPVAETKAAGYSNDGSGDSQYIALYGLPLSVLIGNPICEVSQAQQSMIEQYFSGPLNKEIEQNAPSDNVITFAFEQLECPFCGDYKEKVHKISVPILSTVPVPQVDMENAKIELSMDLKPDVGSGAFEGADHDHGRGVASRTIPVGSQDGDSSAASVLTQYKLSADGKLSRETKADTADLIKSGNDQPLQLTMADSIEEIAANAFIGLTELRRAELPNALKKIGANAFGASKLDHVLIPSGLKNIGKNAFGDCKNMKYLFYCGTQSEWDGITFENANDPIKSVPRYYYSEQAPTESGNFWHYSDGEHEIW